MDLGSNQLQSDGRCSYHFDHHSREFAADPWTVYEHLRRSCPVAHSDAYGGFWVVSRYQDIADIALDTSTFSSASTLIPAFNSYRMLPIHADPPEHARYRRLLNPFFAVRAVRAAEPAIRACVTGAIDSFIEQGRCDVMKHLAQLVATMRTMQLVGLPEEKWEGYASMVHQHDSTRRDDPAHRAAEEALVPLRQELAAVAEERRSHPRADDMVTTLVQAEIDGRRLSEKEITDIQLFIIMAGIDTTKAAIGNALLYLARDRSARERLISQPDLIPLAVEELLRYETSVPALARTATQDCVVGSQQIRQGEKLLLVWASANRDEAVFPEPDRVILDRSPLHLSFGRGVHSCLGATLARAEIRIVLEEVLRRLPDYEVVEEGIKDPQTIGMLYGKVSIPIEFSSAPLQPIAERLR